MIKPTRPSPRTVDPAIPDTPRNALPSGFTTACMPPSNSSTAIPAWNSLMSIGRPGKVLRKLEGDILEVQAGPMKMRVPLDDIAAVITQGSANPAANPVQAARSKGINVRLRDEDAPAPAELNVIGRNVDEATAELEKVLDRAFLAGLTHIRIVHGSGMGILRRALRQYLKTHPQVIGVTEPPQNQGGGGATEVELKV